MNKANDEASRIFVTRMQHIRKNQSDEYCRK